MPARRSGRCFVTPFGKALRRRRDRPAAYSRRGRRGDNRRRRPRLRQNSVPASAIRQWSRVRTSRGLRPDRRRGQPRRTAHRPQPPPMSRSPGGSTNSPVSVTGSRPVALCCTPHHRAVNRARKRNRGAAVVGCRFCALCRGALGRPMPGSRPQALLCPRNPRPCWLSPPLPSSARARPRRHRRLTPDP